MIRVPKYPSDYKPLVYVAAPIDLFFKPAHAAALYAVRKQFPKLHVFDATREFVSTADWLRRWPDLLPRINTLVVVPRPDGSVNGSCAREVLDFCAQQTYGVSVESSPPGLTRVAAIPRLFVFEAGSVKRPRQFSLPPDGTVARMAFISSRRPARSSLRQTEAVWQ